jgi:hypothetical protein
MQENCVPRTLCCVVRSEINIDTRSSATVIKFVESQSFGGTCRLYPQGRKIILAKNHLESRWQAGFTSVLSMEPESSSETCVDFLNRIYHVNMSQKIKLFDELKVYKETE